MRLCKETFEKIHALVGPDCDKLQYTGANQEGVWFLIHGPDYDEKRRAEYFIITEEFELVRRQPHIYVDDKGQHVSKPLLNVPDSTVNAYGRIKVAPPEAAPLQAAVLALVRCGYSPKAIQGEVAHAINRAEENELEALCDQLQSLAEKHDELQSRVDDLCYDEFGDDKATSHINNQGIHFQFEQLAACWGRHDAIQEAKELIEEFSKASEFGPGIPLR